MDQPRAACSWFVVRAPCFVSQTERHGRAPTRLCSCTPVLKEIMSMSMSMSITGIESRVPSVCSTRVTRHDRRIASHRCLRRISTFFFGLVVHCTYVVCTPPSLFLFFLSLLSFIHSFILFFLRPCLPACLPPARLASPVSERPCPLARSLAQHPHLVVQLIMAHRLVV